MAHVIRNMAIFECEDVKKWEGYTESLWKQALEEPGDRWTVYKACAADLPTLEEAAALDGIIVAGSHYSAYEEHEWIDKLLELLPKIAAQGTKVYGCCFGCQILARALGGSVGPNPDGNFVLTIEQIQPTQQLQQFTQLHNAVQQALAAAAAAVAGTDASSGSSSSCATGSTAASNVGNASSTTAATAAATAGDDADAVTNAVEQMSLGAGSAAAAAAAVAGSTSEPGAAAATIACSAAAGCFSLIESHGDQVLQLPPGAVLLASSPTAEVELWCWGPNVLASQFHVEFDEPLVLQKIWASLKDIGRLNEQQAEGSRSVLEAGGSMNGSMLQVIKHFLKHGIVGAAPVTLSNSSSTSNGSGNDSSDGSSTRLLSSSVSTSTPASGTGSSSNNSNSGNSGSSDAGTSSSSKEGDSGTHVPVTVAGCSSNSNESSRQQEQQAEGGDSSDMTAAAAGATPVLELPSSSAAAAGIHNGAGETESTLQLPLPSIAESWPSGLASISTEKLAALDTQPAASGCSSPTAASERSIATASTSSTVPFSHIAHQRRQQKRELDLQDASQRMVKDAAAAFDLSMDGYSLDLQALQQLNDVAAEQYGSTAEIATALGQFVTDLGSRQAAVREALAVLPQLDRQLKVLESAVGQLDRRSKDLELKLGLGPSSRSSAAYEYLTSSLSRAGSTAASVGAAAVGAGGCLGGGALPRQ